MSSSLSGFGTDFVEASLHIKDPPRVTYVRKYNRPSGNSYWVSATTEYLEVGHVIGGGIMETSFASLNISRYYNPEQLVKVSLVLEPEVLPSNWTICGVDPN